MTDIQDRYSYPLKAQAQTLILGPIKNTKHTGQIRNSV